MSSQIVYEVDQTYGCHLWQGKVSSTSGRPIVWRGRTPINAYKLAYELEHGIVPNGLVLDHLCRRPMRCVNPAHLEAVTKQVNELRKFWRYRCGIKRCPRGHDLSTALVTPEMGRLCRTCHLEGGG